VSDFNETVLIKLGEVIGQLEATQKQILASERATRDQITHVLESTNKRIDDSTKATDQRFDSIERLLEEKHDSHDKRISVLEQKPSPKLDKKQMAQTSSISGGTAGVVVILAEILKTVLK